jgi:hypothetical protein
MDVYLGELLHEEQRLTSQLGIAQDAGGIEIVNVAYAAHGKDDTNLHCNVTIARKLGTLQNIAERNSTIIARRKAISLRIVVYALRIDSLLPFICYLVHLCSYIIRSAHVSGFFVQNLLLTRFNR